MPDIIKRRYRKVLKSPFAPRIEHLARAMVTPLPGSAFHHSCSPSVLVYTFSFFLSIGSRAPRIVCSCVPGRAWLRALPFPIYSVLVEQKKAQSFLLPLRHDGTV